MPNNDFISASKNPKKNIVGGKEVLGGPSTPEIPEGPKRLGTVLNAGIEILKNEFKKAGASAADFLTGYKDKDLPKEYQGTKTWTDAVEKERKAQELRNKKK